MLTHIFIKDFAIIREIDIDLSSGLNIITGETGTGKSIVIQAVDMALGGRGSSSLVASWADRALVQLIFLLDESERLLAEKYISGTEDDELIISREFSKNGKSIARVNGEIVTLALLKKITSGLVDIHGQYDNQILLDPENHLEIVDEFAQDRILPLRTKLALTFENYTRAKHELSRIKADRSEFIRKRDFMKFEFDEINAARLLPGEDEELSDRLNVLQNSEKISANLSECYDILYGSQLGKCALLLSSISEYDRSFAKFEESISNCVYELDDICEEIRKARDSVSFAPGDIDSAIERLDLIDKLKRKYGGSIENILSYRDKCAVDLNRFENTEEAESRLNEKISLLEKELSAQSEKLSDLRKEAADRLSEEMTAELHDLNFANVEFAVRTEKKKKPDGSYELTASGIDDIEFLFNANKGGSLKPLASIASGGEISRISLAFKNVTRGSSHVSSMIFDEIDTGISGVTASVVGKKMRQISEKSQIICITHLPQIAAAGDHQYLIAKDDSDEQSFTTIRLLGYEERVVEIARLLGGSNVTEITLASARELIAASH